MAMMRRFCAVGVLVGLGLLLVSSQGAAAAEGDWLDEAAGLVARLDKISTADIPPYVRQHEYLKLLDEVSAFAQAPTPDERERKGRKTFGLLLEGRIQEQLGDGAGAVRAWQGHRRDRDALPEAERAALLPLLERTEGAAKAGAARICEVEARGKEVRVRAVGYPLVALLEKMSEATGEKIEFIPPEGVLRERMEEAMGERIQVEPELSGLVDYVDTDWRRIDHALGLFLSPVGLSGPGKIKDGFTISVGDALYTSSLAERAAKLAPWPKPTRPDTGIEKGYVILSGHYLAPPYRVEFRTTDDRGAIHINSLLIPKSYSLKYRALSAGEPPPVTVEPPKTIAPLTSYVGPAFANIREKRGLEEAKKSVTTFLEQYPYVKSFEFVDNDATLNIAFTDGRKFFVDLSTRKPSAERSDQELARRGEEHREQQIKKALRFKSPIEEALRADGLVVIAPKAGIVMYTPEQAKKRLLAMCIALDEAGRHKEDVRRALFPLPTPQSSESAWEIFLNLRHRELWQRLRMENVE